MGAKDLIAAESPRIAKGLKSIDLQRHCKGENGKGADRISLAGISNAKALDSYEREGLRGSGKALLSRDLHRS